MANPFVDYLKQNYPHKLVGVEIGVFRGENAELILQNVDIEKLYLVDPYQNYADYNVAQLGVGDALEGLFDVAQNKLSKYADKIQFIKKKSNDAHKQIPNGLDFVYIDGNHNYSYVWDDLCNYYPKLKKGGLLAGDNLEIPDVTNAVTKFWLDNELTLQGRRYNAFTEWWTVK